MPRPPSDPARRPGLAVLAGTAYLALAVWTTWPLARHWTDHLVSIDPARAPRVAALGRADHLLNLWILAWDVHALSTAPRNLFQANIFHPMRDALATGEHMLGALPWFAPAYAATGSPTAGVNCLVFVSFVLGGLGMYWLVLEATGRRLAGFAAGLVFAFAPWRSFWLVHLQLVGVHLFPFVLLWLDRAARRGGAATAVFAALLGLQALTSYYLAYMCAVLGAGVLWYLPAPRAGGEAWRRWLGVVAAGLAAAVAVGVLSRPYLRLAAAGVLPGGQREGWLAIASVTPGQLVSGSAVSLGWAVPALALLGLRPRRGAGRLQLAALHVALVGAVLSLGPFWDGHALPWDWLARTVPGFATLRVPGRFLIVATLGLGCLAGLGVARVEEWRDRRPGSVARGAAVVAAVAALLVPVVVRPARHAVLAVPRLDDAPPVYAWLAAHGEGAPLFELPVPDGFPGALAEARAEYMSILHWLPLLNGYSGYRPPFADVYRRLGERLPDPGALGALLDMVDVRWLLVHGRALGAPARARWDAPPAGLALAARFGDDLVFRVTPAAPAGERGPLSPPAAPPSAGSTSTTPPAAAARSR